MYSKLEIYLEGGDPVGDGSSASAARLFLRPYGAKREGGLGALRGSKGLARSHLVRALGALRLRISWWVGT